MTQGRGQGTGGAAVTSEQCREQVSLGCRILAAQGLSDLIWGHVSARDPQSRGAWLKTAGLGFEEVGPEAVHLVDRNGTLVEGRGKVHFEFPIHTEILARRDDVGAVVHAHPEAAVTFAATDMELRPIGHEGSLFTPPGVVRYTETGDLIHTRELGESVARALGDHNALLLRNHGIVTVGPNVPTAVLTAVFLEKACRMQLQAAATHSQLAWSSDEEATTKRARVYSSAQFQGAWDYLVRRLESTP